MYCLYLIWFYDLNKGKDDTKPWVWRSSQCIGRPFKSSYNDKLSLLSTRPAVTFPAIEHHCLLADTKLYCFADHAFFFGWMTLFPVVTVETCWLYCCINIAVILFFLNNKVLRLLRKCKVPDIRFVKKLEIWHCRYLWTWSAVVQWSSYQSKTQELRLCPTRWVHQAEHSFAVCSWNSG